MKNNLTIVHTVINAAGGMGSVILNLVKYQVSKGFHVVVYLAKYDKNFMEELPKEAEVIEHQKTNNIPYILKGLNIKDTYNIIKKKFPDCDVIIHSHSISTIGLFSNIKDIPIVSTIHGITGNHSTSFRVRCQEYLYGRILKKLVRNENLISAVSEDTKLYYSKYINETNIRTIHNGTEIINEKSCNKKKFVIGHVGDISYNKGWDKLVRAYSLIPKNIRRNMELVSAGQLIDFTLEEINEMIREFQLENEVVYLGKVKNAKESVIPNIDILVIISKSEGLPMSILEAQAVGVPVIATDVGGISEVITSGYNGLITEKDVHSIKKNIIELYKKPLLYEEMSTNSKQRFTKNFSLDNMGKSYLKLYAELL